MYSLRARTTASITILLLIAACVPKGARNWLFSIGPQTYAAALGDLDGDGDLDAFLANGENEVPVPNTVWLNDGTGHFTDTRQAIDNRESVAVLLTNMDGDTDLDAVVANTGTISFYLNNGTGNFTKASQEIGPDEGSYVLTPAVGDLNGDGLLDIIAGGCCGSVMTWDSGKEDVFLSYDSLWINDGSGNYQRTNQSFDTYGTSTVALGDLDGDSDLDAVFGNNGSIQDSSKNNRSNQPNSIYFNDGQGNFLNPPLLLGSAITFSAALGDVDGDGDLDIFFGNREDDELWINQGGLQTGNAGSFTLAAKLQNEGRTRFIFLANLDRDNALDVVFVGEDKIFIWMNDGSGGLSKTQQIMIEPQHAPALGDLDGDSDVDIFAGSVNHDILVWLNDGEGSFSHLE